MASRIGEGETRLSTRVDVFKALAKPQQNDDRRQDDAHQGTKPEETLRPLPGAFHFLQPDWVLPPARAHAFNCKARPPHANPLAMNRQRGAESNRSSPASPC